MDLEGNWIWAKQASGNNPNKGRSIITDNEGNSYVTGSFNAHDGTVSFGTYTLAGFGNYDIFVAKLDPNGNWLWVTEAGSTSGDFGHGITLDDNGNSYVTGNFVGTATFGSTTLTSNGNSDIFVAKLDSDGNWQWAVQGGGIYRERGYSITTDNLGNCYIGGYFEEATSFGSTTLTGYEYYDIFVAKLDADANWQWALQAGGNSFDYVKGISIDVERNIYLTGQFADTATFGSHTLTTSSIYTDIYVAKIDENGNWLWAEQAGGIYSDAGDGIISDNNGNSYITGNFADTAIFGSYSLTSNADIDIYVAKIDSGGNWMWAVQALDDNLVTGHSITIDDAGKSYVTGRFIGTATFGSTTLTSSGISDIFVAKLGANTSIYDETIQITSRLSNYPNPFNPTTTIAYSLPNDGMIELNVYNIKGQLVKTLVKEEKLAGSYEIVWNGKDNNEKSVSSGIYFYKFSTKDDTIMKKMLLLK